MRRPLLVICVCLFGLVALFMRVSDSPPWSSEIAVATAEKMMAIGQVYEKEYRVKSGKEVILFYLKLFDYSLEADASNQKNFQKFYDKTPQYKTKIICEVSAEDLPWWKEENIYLPALGETIVFSGRWQAFSHATNPGEFDVANYYAMEGIGGKIELDELLAADGKQWYLREQIFQLRQRLLRNLYNALPQKEAAILAKMLLGDGSGLEKEVRELYQDNGIVHILSISGLHISMIGMGIYVLLRKCSCPLGMAAVLGGVFIVFYGVLTGFGVSACRAVGMYLIHMLGEIWGKTYDMLTAMGVLAVLLVLENPRLVYHSGYLLSFASVCGVGLLVPIFPRTLQALESRPYDSGYKKWLKKRLQNIFSSFKVSLAVTLFTLPVQLFFFYKIPVYSVFINLLVIPFMSVVMVIGFMMMLLPGLQFLCPIESLIFAWFEWLCVMFEKLPGHTWVTGRPSMWKILIYYIVIIVLILCRKYLKNIVIHSILAGIVLFVGGRMRWENTITFLDVGQGDCICVQTSQGECYLFDGGSSSKSNVGEKILLPYLQYCGISELDAVFVSHPDEDHVNGLGVLFASDMTVERLILPAVAEAQTEFAEIIELIDENTGVEYVAQGDIMQKAEPWWKKESDAFFITCLHPKEGYVEESNAYSACYLLELGGERILLTGDVEGKGEEALIQELQQCGVEQIDILKVAHHGSKYSTTQDFLDQVQVRTAVISCGKNNLYGHPHAETLERLEKEESMVLVTAEQGAVIIKWKEQRP